MIAEPRFAILIRTVWFIYISQQKNLFDTEISQAMNKTV